ncbi:MAG: hypothetical protein R3281_18055 [Balneolaceae bacterium]|nr:hypothetical protein [Balneolaceae bacterium]
MKLPNSVSTASIIQSEAFIAFTLALIAAALIKIPAIFGIHLDQHENFYLRNVSLFVLPLLSSYFLWKHNFPARTLALAAVAFITAGVFANIYPFTERSDTETLLALHLPVALWLFIGITYTGGQWNKTRARMDFVRFSGELFIYYVLLALGGGALTAFTALIFGTIGIDIEPFFETWMLPCGSAGTVIIASWLVESRGSMTGNLAPLLARLFTPLFTFMLITFLGIILWSGRSVETDRDMLIAFDIILLVTLGLLLYCISARDTQAPPGVFDVVQVVLVISALLADAVALWAISVRIYEFGFTPNRVAALGLNLVLLVNLVWSAVQYTRFLRGKGSIRDLERWQTDYLPVYSIWAAIVVLLFPPLFGFT